MVLFKKREISQQEQQSVKPQGVATDVLPKCATAHVIADPCCVLADYDNFVRCDSIPVALEEVNSGGWNLSVQIPKNAEVYNYLNSFKSLPRDFRKLTLARTIIEYKLGTGYTIKDESTGKKQSFPGCSLWLLPTGDIIANDNWLSYMNPEIRRDIAKRIRICNALAEQLQAMRNAQAVQTERL